MALEMTPEVREKLSTISLDGFTKHHIPIHIYGEEMGEKADLLREHSAIFLDMLDYEVFGLAQEIDQFKNLMLAQDVEWKDGFKQTHELAEYWHENSARLFEQNDDITSRLDFHFFITDNKAGAETIEEIGESENNHDAVHDARRISGVFDRYGEEIVGRLFTPEEVEQFQVFAAKMGEAHEAANIDRTSPNDERILRDKIYLHLRSLEKVVMKASRAALRKLPDERKRYVSKYVRNQNRKAREDDVAGE